MWAGRLTGAHRAAGQRRESREGEKETKGSRAEAIGSRAEARLTSGRFPALGRNAPARAQSWPASKSAVTLAGPRRVTADSEPLCSFFVHFLA